MLGAACGVALLPKCPMCLAAYLWFFGSVGLSATQGARWVGPALSVVLMAGVASIGLRSGRRHGHGPWLVGLVATTTIVVGKFVLNDPPLVLLGLVVLAAALLWDRWPVAPGGPSNREFSTTDESRSRDEQRDEFDPL